MIAESFFAGYPAGPVHFIGIGGVGMSGLAQLLALSDVDVSGSDLSDGPILEGLRELGVRIEIGHSAKHIGRAGVVVVSSAVPPDNVELKKAHRQGLQILHRSELLAEILRFRVGIAVSGTHGKTTVSAMVATLLQEAGLSPTALIGARVAGLGGNALLGSGRYVVCEADESDRSFLRLPAVHKIVTNVDTDHMDEYGNFEELRASFLEFMNGVPFYGSVIACVDDTTLRDLGKKVHRRVLTYGFDRRAEVSAKYLKKKDFGTIFTCFLRGRAVGEVELKVPGRHNVQNALAAAAVGLDLGVPFARIRRGLLRFEGAERRQQLKGERDGVVVMDDYGHHPTEIKATLSSLSKPGRRTILVYQPHRFSRTQYLLQEMGDCFEGVDRLLVMEIYPAGEEPIPGVNSAALVSQIRKSRQADLVRDRGEAVALLRRELRPGDLLLTMGAGDVWKVGEDFLG